MARRREARTAPRSFKPVRCAIYTRQSADPKSDFTSCEVQFDACPLFVDAHRNLNWYVVGERFDDVGHSGATLDRPAMLRLSSEFKTRKWIRS